MCLGVPGKVVETFQEHDVLMGKVDFGGVTRRVCLDHVPDVAVGEYVLVHVGFALSKMNEAEAREVFDFLEKIGQLDEVAGTDGAGSGDPRRAEVDEREAAP